MDVALIATIATPFLVLLAKLLLERRPNVVAYYSNIAAFRMTEGVINSHTVVLRNNGRQAAEGIRLAHPVLTNDVRIDLQPDVEHTVDREAKTISIPRLRPKEQVQVAYMYPGNFTFNQISGQISHNDALVKLIQVVPTRQFPRWWNIWVTVLFVVGLMWSVNALVNVLLWLWDTRAAWVPIFAGS